MLSRRGDRADPRRGRRGEGLIIGVQSWELALPGCGSLKEKRQVVRSLKERLRNRFNASVAETDHHDVWTRAEITAAIVTTDRRRADELLDKMDRFVEADGRALISGVRRELL